MTGLGIFCGIVGMLVILALLAPRYGVDSRDGRDWNNRVGRVGPSGVPRPTPWSDLRALASAAGRVWPGPRSGLHR